MLQIGRIQQRLGKIILGAAIEVDQHIFDHQLSRFHNPEDHQLSINATHDLTAYALGRGALACRHPLLRRGSDR
jgi:hypothetical protein